MIRWLAVALVLFASPAHAKIKFDAKKLRPGLPNIMRSAVGFPTSIATAANWYAIGFPWCAATTVMVASAIYRRPLKLSEAWTMTGSCILPIVGGLLIKRAFDAHPEWDNLPTTITPYDPSIRTQS